MKAPIIDSRGQAAVFDEMRQDLSGYVPEWKPGSSSPGMVPMYIFARYAGILIDGLNRVPGRSMLAFLDMLGTHLLPAQAARAPLIFTLADNSPVDITLPARSAVAAPNPPTVSSGASGGALSSPPQPLLFATEDTVTLSRGRLAALYSIVPGLDEYSDHSASLGTGFTFFGELTHTEHAIYLGHDNLFNLSGSISVLVSFGLRTPAEVPLQIAWEYLAENGWLLLNSPEEDDTTGGLMRNGSVTLQRAYGPAARQETFSGHTSYWIRGRLTTPLLPDGSGGKKTVPVVNSVRARLDVRKSGLLPEAAFADFASLDPTKDFYPFGQQPTRFATFYVASTEVFQRQSANVQLNFTLSQFGVAQGSLQLSWEFFDGSNWTKLTVAPAPNSSKAYKFTENGTITFVCPGSWKPTTVNGVNNYWLRVRIKSGSYGYPLRLLGSTPIVDLSADRKTITVNSTEGFAAGDQAGAADSSGSSASIVTIGQILDDKTLMLSVALGAGSYKGGTIGPPLSVFAQPVITPGSLHPPVVLKMTLQYRYLTAPEIPDHCLSKNDFVFEDYSDIIAFPDQTFTPFHPVADVQPAVHFGFDEPLPAGLISLYVDIAEAVTQSAPTDATPFIWEYSSASGWNEFGVLDETSAFNNRGMIQFVGQQDAVAVDGLGGRLFRVRARLKRGIELYTPSISGIWLNAVWATQQSLSANELIGMSDGNPGQSCVTRFTPVLAGQVIEVQEWRGNGEGWRSAIQGVSLGDMRFERDPATNAVIGVWVRWNEQPSLYNSTPTSRDYLIERATGTIRFGPPGMIPPGGSAISAGYAYGGGLAGNVAAGSITEMHTAVPYLLGVTNPVAATGGADTESIDSVETRGAQRIRNQDRAVSPSDYEWLAKDASPDVALARCLPITGPDGHAQRGWVSLAIVPRSADPQPQPAPEFAQRILRYVAARVPPPVMYKIRIEGPRYVPVAVHAQVVPKQADQAAQVESALRERLNQFLHPVTGGPQSLGWNFGQSVYLSQIAGVIEDTSGVDYAIDIALEVNGQVFADFVPIQTLSLIAAGKHEIKLALP